MVFMKVLPLVYGEGVSTTVDEETHTIMVDGAHYDGLDVTRFDESRIVEGLTIEELATKYGTINNHLSGYNQ